MTINANTDKNRACSWPQHQDTLCIPDCHRPQVTFRILSVVLTLTPLTKQPISRNISDSDGR